VESKESRSKGNGVIDHRRAPRYAGYLLYGRLISLRYCHRKLFVERAVPSSSIDETMYCSNNVMPDLLYLLVSIIIRSPRAPLYRLLLTPGSTPTLRMLAQYRLSLIRSRYPTLSRAFSYSTRPQGLAQILEKKPDDAVVTFAKRTAIGRAKKGQLKDTPVDEILRALFKVWALHL